MALEIPPLPILWHQEWFLRKDIFSPSSSSPTTYYDDHKIFVINIYRIVFFLAVALTSSALIIERTEVSLSKNSKNFFGSS